MLGISMGKEALEDFRRLQADREVNRRGVLVFSPRSGEWEPRQWRDIVVRAAAATVHGGSLMRTAS